uniref:AMIN domain-containing protein n=1 Tax=candidate division WOR-3 bacterium TaxID=2052148 RepID=A0A7C6AA95_UNCW3
MTTKNQIRPMGQKNQKNRSLYNISLLILSFFVGFGYAQSLTDTSKTAGLTQIKSIAIEQLMDKIRITIRCSAEPNIGVFSVETPPTVIVDFVDVFTKLTEADVAGTKFYPVKAVRPIQWKEVPPIARVEVLLDVACDYNVDRQGNLVVIDIDANPSPVETGLEKQAKIEPTVSMYVKDAEITDILRMLALQFGLNIIATQEVKGLVTVRIQDVPLHTALDALVKAAGCNFIKYNDGLILVKPLKKEVPGELLSKVFELEYSEAQDIKDALKRVISSDGNIEISYRRVADGGGSKRSAVLVVTDRAENLKQVEEMLQSLDSPPPQILITAKLIETTQSAQDLFGTNWTISAIASGQIPEKVKEGGPVAMPIVINNILFGTIDLSKMAAVLSFLQTRNNGRLLCEPQITTLDNQTAEIELSTKYPQPTVVTNPQTGAQSVSWTQLSIPIKLTVTPHVTTDGSIYTSIEVQVDAITGWIAAPLTQGGQQPIVSSRSAKTQVSCKVGEVIVIGGLTKDEVTRIRTPIPILGHIPILGRLLFSSTDTRTAKNNLIIFITPQVIKSEG